MKNFIIGFLALPLFVTAEPFVDYDYSEQVTEMTVITVKPNLIDDYLMGIKRTWVDSCEIQKELGHIVGCSVYTAETAGTDPNVFLTITYENLAAMGPNKERYEEFMTAWRKKISESDQQEIAGGYGDMREIVDLVVLRKVNFK
jgi:hypothetical protein|tara:strand:+ start:62 stop:493 length:432 start_codon:yes stop_codon:yes gene_type:complete